MKTTYQIDPAHSGVHFSVRHLMVTNVRGTFSGVKGTVVYDPANPSTTQVEATVDANTISTGDPKRDAHLKGADFLDAEKYPEIIFKGKRTEKTSDTEFRVTEISRFVTSRARRPSPSRKSPRKPKIPGAVPAWALPPRPKSTGRNSVFLGIRLWKVVV